MGFLPFQGSSKKNTLPPRWFGGISITANCRRIESAMIGIHGHGSGAPVEIRKTISFDLPSEITESYDELQRTVEKYNLNPASESAGFFPLYLHVLRELASVEEEAIEELLHESQLTKNDILAVGVQDAGIRQETAAGLYYQSLCDAPYLADQTGLNIVDAFSMQDLAAHGNGGPVLALPVWIYLKSDVRDRILLDLGRTAKYLFLPKGENAFSHQRTWMQDIVPCGSLLDTLTMELTQNQTPIDIGGRLAVQGCQIPELLDAFRAIAPPDDPWNPLGLSPKPFLKACSSLGDLGFSTQDVLCTSSCFIAETVARQLQNLIEDKKLDGSEEPEILVSGSARFHGMLTNLISTQLRHRPMLPVNQLGFPTETLDALCVAMLTLMTVDHIPSNIPTLTGGDSSKVLGRITPGSAAHWHRLVREMARTKPIGQTLRKAV